MRYHRFWNVGSAPLTRTPDFGFVDTCEAFASPAQAACRIWCSCRLVIGRPNLAAQRSWPGCTWAEPASQSLISYKQASQRRKNSAADRLLLPAQVVLNKLVPSDVASVYTWDRVVHQKLGIDLGNTGDRRDGSERLPKIIAPL